LSELDASATSERLDSVAKVLAGSTAAAAALLTTFGLTSDRVWLLLDQDRLANSLVLTSVAAVLAIGCSLIALLIPPSRYGVQAGVLAVGALLYIGALVGVLLVAGEAGDRAGAPLIQSATITGSAGDRTLEVRIVGQQLDANQSASVSVELGSDTLYASSIPPDFEGRIDQSVVIPLSGASEATR
jgi:hypothetical protein